MSGRSALAPMRLQVEARHQAGGIDRAEAEPAIEVVRVARREHPAP